MIAFLPHVFPRRILVRRLFLPISNSFSGSDQVPLMNIGTVSSTYGRSVIGLLSRWSTACNRSRIDVETHERKLVACVLRALVYIDNLYCSDLECLDLEVLYRCHQFSRTVSVSFILYSIITAVSNLDKFRMGVLPNPEPLPKKSSKLVIPLSQVFKKLIIFEILNLNLS
jgi:hypothetical protein